jgi:hypothetical protein
MTISSKTKSPAFILSAGLFCWLHLV